MIHSGAHKVDGNPYTPLPDLVRARIQAEIDGIRTLFTETVAAGRCRRLTAGAALATEAECFRGAEAVAAGLADEVSDPASAFAAFAAAMNGRSTVRSAGPARPVQSHLSKESIMKPNATSTTAAPATDQTEEQAVPAPVEPSSAPAAPPPRLRPRPPRLRPPQP